MLTIFIRKITDKLRFICSLQAVSKLPGGISTLTTRRKTENPSWRFVGKQASHALFVNVGRKRFPQKKCQNKLACVPVSMRCKISRRSSCNQISSQSTSDTFLERAAKACGIFYLIHVPAPFISEAVPSMYKGHQTHKLLYSKFVELTLIQNILWFLSKFSCS